MIKIRLGMTVPQWWTNFLVPLANANPKNFTNDTNQVKSLELQDALRPYNGSYSFERGQEIVKFKTEQDSTLFILKWS